MGDGTGWTRVADEVTQECTNGTGGTYAVDIPKFMLVTRSYTPAHAYDMRFRTGRACETILVDTTGRVSTNDALFADTITGHTRHTPPAFAISQLASIPANTLIPGIIGYGVFLTSHAHTTAQDMRLLAQTFAVDEAARWGA